MVGVCDGTESVTTTEAQEGRTRRGEVRTGQERESRELELKLELPDRCQGREPGPGRTGESRRWACTAWSPTRHRPSAMSSASASGLVGRGTHQRGDSQSGSSRAPKGRGRCGRWGERTSRRGLGSAGCGLWRRIQWRPLASDLLASLRQVSGQPCNPDASFASPDHLFTFQEVEAILLENRQKTPPPAHRMTARICTYCVGSVPFNSVDTPQNAQVLSAGNHLATTTWRWRRVCLAVIAQWRPSHLPRRRHFGPATGDLSGLRTRPKTRPVI